MKKKHRFSFFISVLFCLFILNPVPTNGHDTLISSSGFKLMFDDIASPFGGIEHLASQLLTPDGRVLLTDVTYGTPHWFKWEGHPSWQYDALRVWTGGGSCCMWYWFVLKTPPYYLLPRFDGGVDDIRLVDLNNDGIMEFETLEDTYSFGTDTAHRTIPKLLWRMTDRGPALASELMKEWHVGNERLEEIRLEIETLTTTAYFGKWVRLLTQTVITQYYSTGDINETHKDFALLWPRNESDPNGWWEEIVRQIACSPFGIAGVTCKQK